MYFGSFEEKYSQKCKCPTRIRSFFFFWMSWWGGAGGAWPCTTCQSCCLGNVENSIDSFLVVTAAGFSHPQAAEIRRRVGFAFFHFFCLLRRPLCVSHFSIHVLPFRLQKVFYSCLFVYLFGLFFNRPTWRLFPRDSTVLSRVATGSRDERLSFSAASPSLPPPVSDA